MPSTGNRAISRMSHDKNDPLFCGFAEANFFATWGNARFSSSYVQKSTEKYPVFIIDRLTRPVAAPPPSASLRRSYRQPVVLALRVLAPLL